MGVGDAQFCAVCERGLQGLQCQVGAVVLLAQMGGNDLLELPLLQVLRQLSSLIIGQVPQLPCDPALEKGRVGGLF